MTFIMEEDEELLREACAVGNVVAAEFYLRKGVPVNCQHKISKFTPLHWAYSRNQENIISLLKKYSADESLLDAKGRVPSECKPIEFQPNYIKNPDLNKLWGIPDSRVDYPKPSKPVVTKPVVQSEDRPIKDTIVEKDVVKVPKDRVNPALHAKMMQILVFSSSKSQSNLKGAVFINADTTLDELKALISNELDEIPNDFHIARVYENWIVPMTLKQMKQNAFMHFSQMAENEVYKNTAELIIISKGTV